MNSRLLLASVPGGLDLNLPLRTSGLQPLHLAAVEGNTAMASYLASNGAAVNAQDFSGRTAIHLAAERGHKDVAKILVVKVTNIHLFLSLLRGSPSQEIHNKTVHKR